MPRAPRPRNLKLIEGRSEGRDSGGRKVPETPRFIRQAPETPADLSEAAAELWGSIVPGLESLDLLKMEDQAALVILCETYATWRAAKHLLRTEGLVLTNPDSGRQHAHPAAGIANAAASLIRQYAAEFGLTPSAESKLATSDPANADPAKPNPFAVKPDGRAWNS